MNTDNCYICDNDGDILLCDHCNRGFHLSCLNLSSVPSGSWYCPGCTKRQVKQQKPKDIKDEPKQVYIYIRISSKGQNNPEFGRVGMDTQNGTILDFCKANNLYVKSCVTEIGSAYHTKTPLLDKLIDQIKKSVPILVYSFSRFSRNVEDCKKKIKAIHEKNSWVWSVTDKMTSKDSAFINLVKAAENESRLLGRRMIDSYSRVIAQGGFTGRKKPFGYNIIRDHNGIRILKENSLEQKIIKKIKEFAEQTAFQNRGAKVIAFAMKKYPRYNWTGQMIQTILCDYYHKNGTYRIIRSEEEDDVGSMFDAIGEIEADLGEEEIDLDTVYTVEEIRKIRVHKKTYQFLVKWENYEEETWENVISLYQDVPEIVQEFLDREIQREQQQFEHTQYAKEVKEILEIE